MTKLQEIQVRESEIREKLNGLLAKDERTDAEDQELRDLTAESLKLQPQIRAAMVAESDEERRAREAVAAAGGVTDPETRERLELRERSTLGGFLLARLEGRLPAGAEAEYGASLAVKPGDIPLDLFEVDRARVEARQRALETRADAVTPAPATGQGATLAPIQPFVFADSIAPRLGIDMPSVGSGNYSEATISTALTAAAKNKGDAQESTAAALTPVTASPRRISGRLSITMEDVAQIGVGNFEAALRQNARAVLADAYDSQCINGDGQAPNVEGLIKQLTDPANPTSVAGFDDFVEAFAEQIDGLWASTMREISIVANVDAYKLSATKFRDRVIDTGQRGGVSLGDTSAADYLAQHTGGWWTNKRMPATASNIARGIVRRMGRPGLRTASHPVWANVAIDDIYSDSGSGTRHFSLHVLCGSKVLIVQPAAYGLVEYKVS